MIQYDVSDGVATVRLDAPPLNTIRLEMLGSLGDAVRCAESDPAVRGIVLVGTAQHFSAGVDIALFERLRSGEEAAELSRVFQVGFQQIEDCGKPVVAALAGSVMGGALELAMACHRRVAVAGSRFSLPEIKLGFNPGAGGTQRLPRLIGLATALRMLLTGEAIGTEEARSLGLVDAVCAAEELLERARKLAAGAATEINDCRDACPAKSAADLKYEREAAFADAERMIAKMRPELIAPRKILEAVRTGLEESFAAGLAYEREAFAACVSTQAAQNKIHLFFATRQAAKTPELDGIEPQPVAKAAVVGMGTMGTGIVQALLAAGLPTVALDENAAARERGQSKVRESLSRRVEQGKLGRDQADRTLNLLSITDDWSALADIDLVIEAVFEDVALKCSVLKRLEETCRLDAILASNTSTISLDALAEGMIRPNRLIGLHFFNPAHRMPLLEVIRPAAASQQTVAAGMRLAKTLRKTPVLIKNRAGFIVSRLFVPYLKEAFLLVQEGAQPDAVDRAMTAFGFPMGPLALIDMAGIDILALTDGVLRREFPWHGDLPRLVARLVERGQLGQKAGAGVYRYEAGDHNPQRSEATEAMIAEIRCERGQSPRDIDSEEISRRLVLRMVAEAYSILEDGIAQRSSDLDVAVVLGIGFPDFRGGVVRYAEDLGLDRVRKELEQLAADCGPRFEPCSLLRQRGN